MRRARIRLATPEIASPSRISSPIRHRAAWSGASASCSGSSAKTSQPSSGMGAQAASTRTPASSVAARDGPGRADGSAAAASAARTWSNCDRSVFWSTRLMSGSAISRPARSTAKARPPAPILMRLMTSQTSLRFTSARVTPVRPPLPQRRQSYRARSRSESRLGRKPPGSRLPPGRAGRLTGPARARPDRVIPVRR